MISLYLIVAHLLGDFVFQTQWMAENKCKNVLVRILHVHIYTACFVPFIIQIEPWKMVYWLTSIFVTHFIIDSIKFFPNAKWCGKSMMVDQALHLGVLAVLGTIFGLK